MTPPPSGAVSVGMLTRLAPLGHRGGERCAPVTEPSTLRRCGSTAPSFDCTVVRLNRLRLCGRSAAQRSVEAADLPPVESRRLHIPVLTDPARPATQLPRPGSLGAQWPPPATATATSQSAKQTGKRFRSESATTVSGSGSRSLRRRRPLSRSPRRPGRAREVPGHPAPKAEYAQTMNQLRHCPAETLELHGLPQ